MTTIAASDFDFLCELVRRDSAIVLEPGKEYLAESRLNPILKKKGIPSIGDLVVQLRSGSNKALQAEIVDAMTTNETSFFRDAHPWEALRHELIPEMLARKADRKILNIWSAACSSGQEPYTLCLLLKTYFADALAGWTVRILATDLSPTMLDKAKSGRYTQLEVNRGLPAPMLLNWFEKNHLEWELKQEIKSMVEFRSFNLADKFSWGTLPQFDLVMMRNVLIYFDQDTKRQILTGIADRLNPGGILFLGSSESTFSLVDCYDRVQSGKTICYRPNK